MRIAPRVLNWYPELALFTDDTDRKRALKQAQRRVWRAGRLWLWSISLGVVNGVVMSIRPWTLIPGLSARIPPVVGQIIFCGLMGGCAGVAFQYLWRKPMQGSIRRQLLDRGIPVCLECGYDLRGRTDPRCPECGSPFDSRLINSGALPKSG